MVRIIVDLDNVSEEDVDLLFEHADCEILSEDPLNYLEVSVDGDIRDIYSVIDDLKSLGGFVSGKYL